MSSWRVPHPVFDGEADHGAGTQVGKCHRESPGDVAVELPRPCSELRWRQDLNLRSVLADSRFQGECIRPLCHATAGKRSARRNRPGRQA